MSYHETGEVMVENLTLSSVSYSFQHMVKRLVEIGMAYIA